MNISRLARSIGLAWVGVVIFAITGCSALQPKPVPPPAFFALDGALPGGGPGAGTAAAPRRGPVGPAAAPTLLVNPPQAGAGFDSQRIIYVRQPHRLEYFAHSEWVDTPARMLAPLIVSALDRAGTFRAVVATPTAVSADLRLDTEIVRLQHEFGATPSRVRLTMRATLSDNTTHQVLAQVDFDNLADATSEDAYGGVVAANHATRVMLQALAAFSSQVVEQWRAQGGGARRAVGRL